MTSYIANTSTKLKRVRGRDAQYASHEPNVLFDVVSANVDIGEVVSKWLTFFHNNRVGATAELFNFIFMCCGAQKNWLQPTTDLETLDGGELEELLSEMMKAMVAAKAHVHYPLQTKKGLRDHYVTFFTSLVATQLRLHNSLSSLTPVIDTLIALSSTALNNIRDAATEASLVTLSQCVAEMRKLETENSILEQRITPMLTGQEVATEAFEVLAARIRNNKENIAALSKLSSNLFNGVFIHRYKDTLEVIRWRVICHLGQWIVTHRETYMTEEYLTYVGWMLSDPDTDTRLESVETIKSIVETPNATHRLQRFVDRFMDRMIEIAACDSYAPCSTTMLQAFRAMQRVGLLDTLPQEKLDALDGIVFASTASASTRVAALALMMEHTMGFDISEDNHLIQCEMLLEFCEYHLQDTNADLGKLLAEACLSLPHSGILTDWSMICSLLLREAEALTSFRITVLLHMLLFTAEFLYDEEARASKSKNYTISKEWQAFHEILFSNLPALLHRYRNNATDLELLLQLYRLYNDPELSLNDISVVVQLYLTTTDYCSLGNVVKLMSFWCESYSSEILLMQMQLLYQSVWVQIQTGVDKLNVTELKSIDATISGVDELTVAMLRLSLLWANIDCRKIRPHENITSIITVLRNIGEQLLKLDMTDSALPDAVIHTAYTLYHMLLWYTKDLFTQAVEAHSSATADVTVVCSLRDTLASLLLCCMQSDTSQRMLHVEGFFISANLHALFPSQLEDVGLRGLVWRPTQDVVTAMEKVFLKESLVIFESGELSRSVLFIERIIAPLLQASTSIDEYSSQHSRTVELLKSHSSNTRVALLTNIWKHSMAATSQHTVTSACTEASDYCQVLSGSESFLPSIAPLSVDTSDINNDVSFSRIYVSPRPGRDADAPSFAKEISSELAAISSEDGLGSPSLNMNEVIAMAEASIAAAISSLEEEASNVSQVHNVYDIQADVTSIVQEAITDAIETVRRVSPPLQNEMQDAGTLSLGGMLEAAIEHKQEKVAATDSPVLEILSSSQVPDILDMDISPREVPVSGEGIETTVENTTAVVENDPYGQAVIVAEEATIDQRCTPPLPAENDVIASDGILEHPNYASVSTPQDENAASHDAIASPDSTDDHVLDNHHIVPITAPSSEYSTIRRVSVTSLSNGSAGSPRLNHARASPLMMQIADLNTHTLRRSDSASILQVQSLEYFDRDFSIILEECTDDVREVIAAIRVNCDYSFDLKSHKEFDQALHVLSESLQGLDDFKDCCDSDKALLDNIECIIYFKIGEIYEEMGENPSAIECYDKAITGFRMIDSPIHNSHSILILYYIGNLVHVDEGFSAAKYIYENVIEMADTLDTDTADSHLIQAIIFTRIADAYAAEEEYDIAEHVYERAIILYDDVLGPDNEKSSMVFQKLSELRRLDVSMSNDYSAQREELETEPAQLIANSECDTAQHEPVNDIIEDAAQQEPIDDIIDEDAAQQEPIDDIIDEDAAQQEPVNDIIEDAAQQEPIDDIIEDTVQHEPVNDIIEDAAQQEPINDIIEDAAQQEPIDDIIEDTVQQEPIARMEEVAESVADETPASGIKEYAGALDASSRAVDPNEAVERVTADDGVNCDEYVNILECLKLIKELKASRDFVAVKNAILKNLKNIEKDFNIPPDSVYTSRDHFNSEIKAVLYHTLAESYEILGNTEKAIRVYRKCLKQYRCLTPPSHYIEILNAQYQLSRAIYNNEGFVAACSCYEEFMHDCEMNKSLRLEIPFPLMQSMYEVAILFRNENHARALEMLTATFDCYAEALGENHAETCKVRDALMSMKIVPVQLSAQHEYVLPVLDNNFGSPSPMLAPSPSAEKLETAITLQTVITTETSAYVMSEDLSPTASNELAAQLSPRDPLWLRLLPTYISNDAEHNESVVKFNKVLKSAIATLEKSDTATCHRYLKKAYKLIRENKNSFSEDAVRLMEWSVYCIFGDYYVRINDMKNAILHFNKATKKAADTQDEKYISMFKLACCMREVGDTRDSQKILKKIDASLIALKRQIPAVSKVVEEIAQSIVDLYETDKLNEEASVLRDAYRQIHVDEKHSPLLPEAVLQKTPSLRIDTDIHNISDDIVITRPKSLARSVSAVSTDTYASTPMPTPVRSKQNILSIPETCIEPPAYQKVFIYGDLRKNQLHHHILCDTAAEASYLCTTATLENYSLYIDKFSGVSLLVSNGASTGVVIGELYQINSAFITRLAEYHPSMQLSTCHVRNAEGKIIECSTFISHTSPTGELLSIPRGDYSEFIRVYGGIDAFIALHRKSVERIRRLSTEVYRSISSRDDEYDVADVLFSA